MNGSTGTDTGAPKSGNGTRTVEVEAIHPGTVAALRRLWLAQGRPSEGLVIRNSIGVPVDPSHYSKRFRRLYLAAGAPRLVSIHNVRHSLATMLQAAGVPDHEAAALFGHDVATYRRFYLVTNDVGAQSAALIAGRLFAG